MVIGNSDALHNNIHALCALRYLAYSVPYQIQRALALFMVEQVSFTMEVLYRIRLLKTRMRIKQIAY